MIEPENVARFTRELRAMVKAAGDDPAAFRQVIELLTMAQDGLPMAYAALASQGFSAADVAAELGVSRQAVRQRYARKALCDECGGRLPNGCCTVA